MNITEMVVKMQPGQRAVLTSGDYAGLTAIGLHDGSIFFSFSGAKMSEIIEEQLNVSEIDGDWEWGPCGF